MNNTVKDFTTFANISVYTEDNNSVNVTHPVTNTVHVIEKGPKGDKGEKGQDAVTVDTGSFAITGSNIFLGNQTITGSLKVTDGISPFFTINSNGYVGLNTSTPTTQLDVIGNTYITGGLALNYGTNTGNDLFIIRSGSFPALRVTNEGLLVLGAYEALPTAQAGAVVYSESGDFYLGF
jgi:hypothetical protein